MDSARGYEDVRQDSDPAEGGVGDASGAIGTDERRMHVRAYNHWVSLLRERSYPTIGDLDPDSIADFGPNSVLLDFTHGVENPAIQFIGRSLREECGMDAGVAHIADVPARSLLSRLTDHYFQIIANRAPIGFEAEFVGTRGHNTFYRGILMPFSSDAESIDFIYGVISWKEMVAAEDQEALTAQLALTVRGGAGHAAWADGPRAADDERRNALQPQLDLARESAATAVAASTRSHAALYRALGRVHDFALAAERDEPALAALLRDAGIRRHARAPMTALAKLIFGADYDKTRLAEIVTVLAHAARRNVPEGGLPRLLDTAPGGIKGVVAAERAARRRPAARPDRVPLAARPTLATVPIDAGVALGSAVLIVGRAGDGGTVEVVGTIADRQWAERALARIA